MQQLTVWLRDLAKKHQHTLRHQIVVSHELPDYIQTDDAYNCLRTMKYTETYRGRNYSLTLMNERILLSVDTQIGDNIICKEPLTETEVQPCLQMVAVLIVLFFFYCILA